MWSAPDPGSVAPDRGRVGACRHPGRVTFGTPRPWVGIGRRPAGFPRRRRCQVRIHGKLLLAVAVLLLVLGLALTGCRKDNGSGGGGYGYLPAPTRVDGAVQ
jgi:hypothetical protein